MRKLIFEYSMATHYTKVDVDESLNQIIANVEFVNGGFIKDYVFSFSDEALLQDDLFEKFYKVVTSDDTFDIVVYNSYYRNYFVNWFKDCYKDISNELTPDLIVKFINALRIFG